MARSSNLGRLHPHILRRRSMCSSSMSCTLRELTWRRCEYRQSGIFMGLKLRRRANAGFSKCLVPCLSSAVWTRPGIGAKAFEYPASCTNLGPEKVLGTTFVPAKLRPNADSPKSSGRLRKSEGCFKSDHQAISRRPEAGPFPEPATPLHFRCPGRNAAEIAWKAASVRKTRWSTRCESRRVIRASASLVLGFCNLSATVRRSLGRKTIRSSLPIWIYIWIV